MKLGTLLMQLESAQHQCAVYDELVAYLDKALEDEFEIPSPTESGVVPHEAVTLVRTELLDRKNRLEQMLSSAEDVEVGNVKLEALGDGGDSEGG
jgi:hypothetical protein